MESIKTIKPTVLPVLEKISGEHSSYDEAERLSEEFKRTYVKVKDVPQEYQEQYEYDVTADWNDKMEIIVVDDGRDGDIKRVKLYVAYVPEHEKFRFAYKGDPWNSGDPEREERYNTCGASIMDDIVKYGKTLLIPYLYGAVFHNPDEEDAKERLDSVKNVFGRYGVDITGVGFYSEIDEDEPEPPAWFVHWFLSVAESLRLAKQYDIYEILGDQIYVAYGDFDPVTRTQERCFDKGGKDSDEDDED